MRLVTYTTNLNDGEAPGVSPAGILLPLNVVVDLTQALKWLDEHSRKVSLKNIEKNAIVTMQKALEIGVEAIHQAFLAEIPALDFLPEVLAREYPAAIHDLENVHLLSPLPQPPSIRDFYAFEQHVRNARKRRGLEMIPEWYEFPVFYFSNTSAVSGPGSVIPYPKGTQELDFELELACIIGRSGKNISAAEARQYIAGYMIMNDWSARDIQRKEMKVGLGPAKGKDFATSFGPWLVTSSELASYELFDDKDRMNLEMKARINGEQTSSGNFADIYFTFSQMIERASQDAWLHPGDIIGSGTVGTGCIVELGPEVHPWLQPGDEIELEITGLGVLRNRIGSTDEQNER